MSGTSPGKRGETLPPRHLALVFLLGAALVSAGCKTTPEAEFEDIRPADELYAEGQEILKGTSILWVYTYIDYDHAIEVFQSIIDNYPYSEYAVEAELQIADAYFDSAKYEEALTYYRDFGDLHPQNPRVPYAIFRSALCHAEQVRAPGRDQSATRKALEFLDRLLVAFPNSEHAKEAEKLWRELQIRSSEHIEGIGDYYRGSGEYEAAAERYRGLLNQYPGLGLDARVLFKLAACYEALNRLDEADRIYRTIVAHYPESPYAFRADRRIASNLEVEAPELH
jgi:outer membrane protein assembly factor BamD